MLTFYSDLTPINPPSAAPTIEGGTSATTVEEGSTVQINWAAFTCPSGTGSVSAYNLTAVNGTFPATGQSTASFGPTQRPIDLVVANAPGQSLFVTYTVTCTGNGVSRDSGESPQGQAVIEPIAAPDPPRPPSPTP